MQRKRLSQTISLMLALILSFQLLPLELLNSWRMSAQATDTAINLGYSYFTPQASDNTIDAVLPATFIDETVPQPVLTTTADDCHYINLLKANCSFQDLPSDKTDFLVRYTGISEEQFLSTAADGISLADAVNIIPLAEVSGYSVSEIADLELSINDYINITFQFELYNACVSPEIDAGLDQKLRDYILSGNTCEQVLNAYAASRVFEIEMEPLLVPDSERELPTALTSSQVLLVRNFSNELNISSAAVADHLIANRITATDLKESSAAINAEKSRLMIVPLGPESSGIYSVGDTVFPENIASPYVYS